MLLILSFSQFRYSRCDEADMKADVGGNGGKRGKGEPTSRQDGK